MGSQQAEGTRAAVLALLLLGLGCEGPTPTGTGEAGTETGASDEDECEPSYTPIEADTLVAPYDLTAAELVAPLDAVLAGEALWQSSQFATSLPWESPTALTIEHNTFTYALRDYCGPRLLLVDSTVTLSIAGQIVAEKAALASALLKREEETWMSLPSISEVVLLTEEFIDLGVEFGAEEGEYGADLLLRLDSPEANAIFSASRRVTTTDMSGLVEGVIYSDQLAVVPLLPN